MATTLGEEVRQVQNPALGALLQWRFVMGYSEARKDASACPIPLLFLVCPVLFHEETYRHLASTRSTTGLRGFVAKFGVSSHSQADVLLALHDRARAMKVLSRDSMRIAAVSRLIGIDPISGTVFSLMKTLPKSRTPEAVQTLARDAKKLGSWCGTLTITEVASILKVRF